MGKHNRTRSSGATSVSVEKIADVPPVESPTARGKLLPRPDRGLPFTDALDETMREHHTVFAALAK